MSGPARGGGAPALEVRDLCFRYPVALAGGPAGPVLRHASMSVPAGAFALLTGSTGSGKTTLLRLAKPELAPAGERSGAVLVGGVDARGLDARASSMAVGYVSQSPESQMVCDTVWHELAFGLENLGVDEGEMRLRIAETCQFLGMEAWFRARTHELSGGQKQLLALASVLVMRPQLLLLDEPTAQLDPVSERSFLSLLFRVNRELGVTVVVATHRPEPMADYATHAFRLADGSVRPASPGVPAHLGDEGGGLRHRKGAPSPLGGTPRALCRPMPALSLEDVWFRYGRDAGWVLRGCDLLVEPGEARALMGGNGSGKTTLLSLAAGAERPRRGSVRRPLAPSQALLPQSPRALLGCETVADELGEWSRTAGYGATEVDAALARLGLSGARGRHPLDLSLGQQQLLALEKLLLMGPQLLLLDEPTKGLDDEARSYVLRRLGEASASGATIVVSTHDVGFVRAACQTVSLLFDGQTQLTCGVEDFLARSWVYGGMR